MKNPRQLTHKKIRFILTHSFGGFQFEMELGDCFEQDIGIGTGGGANHLPREPGSKARKKEEETRVLQSSLTANDFRTSQKGPSP
jgi:hypothetical protein